ncbi:MAG: glycosyltransferase family 39 protein [Acidobacteria bacterium]|nr:glycosyltransferase family 39 protein [Acidobacteriota bacterium]
MTIRLRAEAPLFSASLLAFLLFAAAWIHLPGPQQDELLHLPVLSTPVRPGAPAAVEWDGHRLPLMIMSYVGALKGWLLWLWFLVIPMTVPGYRAFGIAVGAVALWLIFRFVRRWYGSPIALLTAALVSTDPSFVYTIRLDFGPTALMHLFKMGGLVLLTRWLDAGSCRALVGGMFFFGLGLWDKANFIWILSGLAATIVLLFPRETLERLRSSRSALPLAVAALLLGAAPLLFFNWKYSGQTWRERGQFEVTWFKLLQAQSTFRGDFMASLTGEDLLEPSPSASGIALPRLAGWMYRLGQRHYTITLPLLALALLLMPLNLWVAHRAGAVRRLLFPLLTSLFIYACMFVTFDGGASAHHVIMLQPFPLLFLAVSLWMPTEQWPRLRLGFVAVVITLAAVAVNFSVNARQLAIYTRTGGTGGFTDAVYRLVPYLAQNPERRLYALDWGFSNPVAFLGARWKLHVEDLLFSLNNPSDPGYPEQVKRLEALMRDRNNAFLLHSPWRTFFPGPRRAFFSLAESGVEMQRVARFAERSGEEIYEVYRRGPSAASVEGPERIVVQFTPDRVAPQQQYTIQVREFPDTWIDLVYSLDQSFSRTAVRFCRLDVQGRAVLTVPVTHPAATVWITHIRPAGGHWLPARGSITVVR